MISEAEAEPDSQRLVPTDLLLTMHRLCQWCSPHLEVLNVTEEECSGSWQLTRAGLEELKVWRVYHLSETSAGSLCIDIFLTYISSSTEAYYAITCSIYLLILLQLKLIGLTVMAASAKKNLQLVASSKGSGIGNKGKVSKKRLN